MGLFSTAGTVLYLALEGDYHRLQERLYRMFRTDSTDNLHFAIKAADIENGLDEQLESFMRQHPDTSLIIIDTLQKIREVGGEKYSYANDYEIIARMKEFADKHSICLLLVHHTRKQTADDKFDMISGTTGLLGAADGAFLLQKKKRTSNAATLEVSGRDQPDQKLYISRTPETLQWELEDIETDMWQEPPDPLLNLVQRLVTTGNPVWSGTATELAVALQLDITPIALAMRLNVRAGKLMNDYHIHYQNTRTHAGRVSRLEPEQQEKAAQEMSDMEKCLNKYRKPPAPYSIGGKHFDSMEESIADLKNPNKDASYTAGTLLAAMDGFIDHFHWNFSWYSSPECTVAFPLINQEQFDYISERFEDVCGEIHEMLQVLETAISEK